MKKNKHPEMTPVLFVDSSEGGGEFLINSTATSTQRKTVEYNNKKYECFVINVNTSSKTHPAYSGKFGAWSDTDNRIKDFNEKFGMFA